MRLYFVDELCFSDSKLVKDKAMMLKPQINFDKFAYNLS